MAPTRFSLLNGADTINGQFNPGDVAIFPFFPGVSLHTLSQLPRQHSALSFWLEVSKPTWHLCHKSLARIVCGFEAGQEHQRVKNG